MRISDWSSDVCSSDLLALAKRIRFVMGVILLRTLDDLAVDRVRDPAFDENHHRLVGLVGNDCSGKNALGHVHLLKPGPGRRAPRSEERRVGTEVVGPCRIRWSQ